MDSIQFLKGARSAEAQCTRKSKGQKGEGGSKTPSHILLEHNRLEPSLSCCVYCGGSQDEAVRIRIQMQDHGVLDHGVGVGVGMGGTPLRCTVPEALAFQPVAHSLGTQMRFQHGHCLLCCRCTFIYRKMLGFGWRDVCSPFSLP